MEKGFKPWNKFKHWHMCLTTRRFYARWNQLPLHIYCNIEFWLTVHADMSVTRQSTCNIKLRDVKRTRKSKTGAVLQTRSMLKLGVICKFMKRYGKCFMSWNVNLEFQVLCLEGVIFLSISGTLYTGRVRNFGYFLQFV